VEEEINTGRSGVSVLAVVFGVWSRSDLWWQMDQFVCRLAVHCSGYFSTSAHTEKRISRWFFMVLVFLRHVRTKEDRQIFKNCRARAAEPITPQPVTASGTYSATSQSNTPCEFPQICARCTVVVVLTAHHLFKKP
jgi:hypothetical protein